MATKKTPGRKKTTATTAGKKSKAGGKGKSKPAKSVKRASSLGKLIKKSLTKKPRSKDKAHPELQGTLL